MFLSCPCFNPGKPTLKAESLKVFAFIWRIRLYLFVSLDTYTLGIRLANVRKSNV